MKFILRRITAKESPRRINDKESSSIPLVSRIFIDSAKRSSFNVHYSMIIILCSLFISNCTPAQQRNEVYAQHGMVVSAEPLATQVGVRILEMGGNAVDAAVAVGFALAVTYPTAGNIGGGGFMVIRFPDGTSTTIDYREIAPIAARPDLYLDGNGNFVPELSQEGETSSGVPGSVAGLLFALEKYGTMKLQQVIQPAVDLAALGFILPDYTAHSFNSFYGNFCKYESTKKAFTNFGNHFQTGDLFQQPDLAATLSSVRDFGTAGFYTGWVADSIVAQMTRSGGFITHNDLLAYKPVERAPVTGTYRGYEIISMAPPSSGGIALIQLLNILENTDLSSFQRGSADYFHLLAEAMKRVYADRSEHLGDPDFFTVPQSWLISKSYAKEIFSTITGDAAPSSSIYPGVPVGLNESTETTHYSVLDSSGCAVSVTTTINSAYGSGVVVSGCGFLLNNEMDDFSAKPGEPNQFGLLGSVANSIQPGKRMLSSMTPTIVTKNGKPFLILGSPGGSTIITAVLQVILNVIDFGLPLFEAQSAPRMHHQWYPEQILIESDFADKLVIKQLKAKGHKIKTKSRLGLVEAILVDTVNNRIVGVTDPRGNGLAEGY